MNRSLHKAAFGLLLVASVAGATVAVDTRRVEVDGIQQALDYLRGGRNFRAHLVARDLVAKETFSGRAWIIVAESLHRRRQYERAITAYREFLVTCDAPETRQYVMEQLRHCRSQQRIAKAPVSPSASLTDAQRAALSTVDPNIHTVRTAHFIVHARNASLATLVANEAEKALLRICGDILPQDYPHLVEIYVWPDRQQYRTNAPDLPEWAGGSFTIRTRNGRVTRRIDLTQLDTNRRFDPIVLDRVLPHEMCHLVLTEYFGDAKCPLFLNEGLAMLAEWPVDNQRLKLAAVALAGTERIELDRLLVAGARDIKHEGVFYAESLSLVSYLHSRLTGAQFKRMLESVKEGCTVADALQRAVYCPPDAKFLSDLSAAWQAEAIRHGQDLKALEAQQLADAY